MKTLVFTLSAEDPLVQSWGFLCLASIAAEDQISSVSTSPSTVASTGVARGNSLSSGSPAEKTDRVDATRLWEQVWNYAIRRINLPTVGRAASHAAYSIIYHEQLPHSALLGDIEGYLKDIELQGPSFPYDTVCGFLSICLEVACKDLRLFRLEYEEKVLNWLISAWSVVDGTTKGFNINSKLENHSPNDLLGLLSTLCRFSVRVEVLQQGLLPDSDVVSYLLKEKGTEVIREYVVYARLPLSTSSPSATAVESSGSRQASPSSPSPETLSNLIGRPRKASGFLLKLLDSLNSEWSETDLKVGATPEKVRRSLDLVGLSLCFEALLQMNGITSSRRTVKRACFLLASVAPVLFIPQSSFWDLAVMIQGLEPLLLDVLDEEDLERILLAPGPMTGVRKSLLLKEESDEDIKRAEKLEIEKRAVLQSLIWQSSDVSSPVF